MLSRQQLFKDATYSLSELVRKVKVRHLDANDQGQFSETLVLEENAKWVSEQYHRKFGRCYTFYPADDTINLGIYYIVLEL